MNTEKTYMQWPLVGLAGRLEERRGPGPKAKRRESMVVLVDGQECVTVPLTRGMIALVDKEDAPRVIKYPWFCKTCGALSDTLLYAARRRRKGEDAPSSVVKLHQFILGYTGIDHANRNGLDNRRINLRQATQSQNGGNSKVYRSSTSGLKGVIWRRSNGRRRGRWIARIGNSPSRIHLGSFQNQADAIMAYNEAAIKRWGEFARLNTIPSQTISAQLTKRRNNERIMQ